MSDLWYDFWVGHGAGYSNGVNLRPHEYDYKEAVNFMVGKMPIKSEDKLLDVGCGNGQMLEQISKYTRQVSGTDYSQNMVRLAEALMKKTPGVVGEYHVSYAEHLICFANDTFDKVVSFAMMQYFSSEVDFHKVLEEMLRVCKPGGQVYLGDNPDSRKMAMGIDGMYAFDPEKIAGKYTKVEYFTSYYEPQRRYDMIITKHGQKTISK